MHQNNCGNLSGLYFVALCTVTLSDCVYLWAFCNIVDCSVCVCVIQLIKSFYNETYTERLGQIDSSVVTLLWSLTTALYFPGGMIGAFAAGFLADKVGRWEKQTFLADLLVIDNFIWTEAVLFKGTAIFTEKMVGFDENFAAGQWHDMQQRVPLW